MEKIQIFIKFICDNQRRSKIKLLLQKLSKKFTKHRDDENKQSNLRIVYYRHCKLGAAFFIRNLLIKNILYFFLDIKI